MSFRFDSAATIYLVNPLRTLFPSNEHAIPILMYHSISKKDEGGLWGYYRTVTTPEVFASHMRYLHDNEYSTISLPAAVKLLEAGGSTNKFVVITFDDGFCDFHRYAFPELARWGFIATVFLPAAYIGHVPRKFKDKECLTWRQIRDLRGSNIYFGSHTVTHPQLTALKLSEVAAEILDSKRTIENELAESIDSFAYPFAFPEHKPVFIHQLKELLVESGYRQGVSTRIGLARETDDRFFLRRLPMNSLDDISLFSAKLNGGYDWLSTFQRASKMARSILD